MRSDSRRDVLRMLGSLALGGATAAPVRAAGWPARPVTLMLPSGPGGGSDQMLRLLAGKLQEKWGQPVVVDYKPGANTVIGTELVLNAPPDGYLLGAALTAIMINPAIRERLPYDTQKDIAGLSLLGTSDFGMFAHPSFPVNSIPELIEYARKNPGKLSYATGGIGSGSHLAWELFNSMAGLKLVHVPYSRGGAAALVDVLAGHVPLLIDVAFGVMPTVQQKKLKVLGLASPSRSAIYPDVPLIADTVPNFSTLSYMGVIGSARMPQELKAQISRDIRDVIRAPDTRERMLGLGLNPVGSTPEEYTSLIASEVAKWRAVIKAADIKVS
ncbi:MAG TPA: tripartite tricarboxylate transporter substrate binding protein [Ramlibacter sp.]|nr:tripartite tricarboxylate transporter substrate binding protein [Ramlibacter sp.]